MRPKIFMGLLILVGSLLWGGEGVWARDMTAREKKQAEKELKQLRYEQARQALESQSFVLVADRLSLPRGNTVYLTGGDNFVMLDQGNTIVQYALCSQHLHQNGAGGFTFAGKLSEASHRTTSKGEEVYSFKCVGKMGGSIIDVSLYPGDNYARALLNGTGKTVFWGKILSVEEANMFVGHEYIPIPVGMYPSR